MKSILCLGSNLGNRKENIERAKIFISKFCGKILKETEILETKPFGVTRQPYFLNQGILVETALLPFELLKVIKQIEKRVGRYPTYRWGPRVIDIDILTYENIKIDTNRLKIPHPGITSRDFFKNFVNKLK